MAETKATYKVTATVVKVAVGPADGNRVARFVDRGDIIPDGVEQGILDQLVKLGRIEKVTEEPAEDLAAEEAARTAEAKAVADAKAKADADAKAAAAAKAKADADAKTAADAKATTQGKTTAAAK